MKRETAGYGGDRILHGGAAVTWCIWLSANIDLLILHLISNMPS